MCCIYIYIYVVLPTGSCGRNNPTSSERTIQGVNRTEGRFYSQNLTFWDIRWSCIWSALSYGFSPSMLVWFNSILIILLSKKSITRCKPHGYRNSQRVHLYIQSYTNNCWIHCKSVRLTYLYKGVHIKKLTLFTKVKFIISHLQDGSIVVHNVRG